jgi:chloramphenicol-sensitive protein RarD
MNKGILSGIAAYTVWGFFPIYFKAMQAAPALQIVAHRLAWSLVFLMIVVTIRRAWIGFRPALNRRGLLIYVLAAALLSFNWLVYIYGVNAGFILETSLGYFTNPLVNVLLGVVFLRERLSLSKWIPIGIAAAGVLYLTIGYGRLPWIALALAFSFGLYGLTKKLAPLGSLHGLSMETAILFVPAVVYLVVMEMQGSGAFGRASTATSLLLALSGVITAVPLLLFASAARAIPLSTLGLLQYIAPTIQFLVGVLIYGEEFTPERVVAFSLIWLALLILTVGGAYERRARREKKEPQPQTP